MTSKTEEFLNFLLWSLDKAMRPTFRNLTDSYESWAYRNGLLPQVRRLEQRELLERDNSNTGDRLYRLTALGRSRVLGGRDPEERWSRRWDGQWRIVLFDISSKENSARARLRRYLRESSFGYLQNSVWISPDPLTEEQKLFKNGKINVESLVLMEARPCAGESDAEIVAGAWDFVRINRRYERHLNLLEKRPAGELKTDAAANSLLRWSREEHQAWLEAVTNDPLLPDELLPDAYLGRQALRRRMEVLREAGQQLKTLKAKQA